MVDGDVSCADGKTGAIKRFSTEDGLSYASRYIESPFRGAQSCTLHKAAL